MTIKITAISWIGVLVLSPMSVWGQQTFTTRVTYDNLAQIERFEFPDGSCVQYEYHNEMGIASTVTYQSGTESQTFVSDVTLNESGLVTSVEIPNGQKTYHFDSLNQLTGQRFDYSGATRYHAKNMAYNHLGGLKRLTRQDGSISGTIQYGYTEQGQLRTFELGSQTATYRYDAHGNLTAVNGFSTADDLEIPTYSAGNNAYKDDNRNRNWDYDPEGRLLKDDRHQYYYDLTGRLAMVRDLATGIPLQTYLYDGAGNRVRTSDIREGSVTYTVRDGSGAIITEKVDHSTAPDRTTNTIHHNGETIATWTREEGAVTPETEQIFNDYLGSPVVVISDTEIKNHEYGPFGQQMSEPRNSGSHGYTGHEEDEGTALTYMKARYYDASTARFLTPDPARDFNPYLPASLNLYQYVRNDPINFIDPTGLVINESEVENNPLWLAYKDAFLATDEGQRIWDALQESEAIFTVKITDLGGSEFGRVDDYEFNEDSSLKSANVKIDQNLLSSLQDLKIPNDKYYGGSIDFQNNYIERISGIAHEFAHAEFGLLPGNSQFLAIGQQFNAEVAKAYEKYVILMKNPGEYSKFYSENFMDRWTKLDEFKVKNEQNSVKAWNTVGLEFKNLPNALRNDLIQKIRNSR